MQQPLSFKRHLITWRVREPARLRTADRKLRAPGDLYVQLSPQLPYGRRLAAYLSASGLCIQDYCEGCSYLAQDIILLSDRSCPAPSLRTFYMQAGNKAELWNFLRQHLEFPARQ